MSNGATRCASMFVYQFRITLVVVQISLRTTKSHNIGMRYLGPTNTILGIKLIRTSDCGIFCPNLITLKIPKQNTAKITVS